MPGFPPTADMPPLLPCVAPIPFIHFVYDSESDVAALVRRIFDAFHSTELDIDSYTLDDIKLLPPGFS